MEKEGEKTGDAHHRLNTSVKKLAPEENSSSAMKTLCDPMSNLSMSRKLDKSTTAEDKASLGTSDEDLDKKLVAAQHRLEGLAKIYLKEDVSWTIVHLCGTVSNLFMLLKSERNATPEDKASCDPSDLAMLHDMTINQLLPQMDGDLVKETKACVDLFKGASTGIKEQATLIVDEIISSYLSAKDELIRLMNIKPPTNQLS